MKLELILEIFAHQKVYNELLNFIANCNVGDKIPSENVLATTFGITRATVRQGIARLKNEGLVYSRQGGGNYIAPQKIKYELSFSTSFTKEIEKNGSLPFTKILELKEMQASDDIAHKLGINSGEDVVFVKYLRLVDSIPFLYTNSYLNTKVLKDIKIHVQNYTSITKLLNEVYDIYPVRTHSEIEILTPNEEQSKVLEMQSFPLIKISSNSINPKTGEILEHVSSFFRSDRTKITVNFR